MTIRKGSNIIAGPIASRRSIGEIVASVIPLIDAELHLLDGSLISGSGIYSEFVTYIARLVSNYPDLFDTEVNYQASINAYGTCGKFVYDDVNNTVRLPKITGFIEGTTDLTALGDLVEAGLPNITAVLDDISALDRNTSSLTSGAITTTVNKVDEVGNGILSSQIPYIDEKITLDASNSSSVYGNSTTVQPQTIKVLYYIVIATSTKTNIQVDLDDVTSDLNLINNQLTNVVHLTGNETISGNKTFTERVYTNAGLMYINNVTKGTVPNSAQSSDIYISDSTKGWGDLYAIGLVRTTVNNDNSVHSQLQAFKNEVDSTATGFLRITYDTANNTYFASMGGSSSGTNWSATRETSSIGINTIPTMGWVNNPATSTNVVHRSSDETIGGTKTFTYNTYIKRGNPYLNLDNTNYTKGTAPSSNYYSAIVYRDKEGNQMGFNRICYNASKAVWNELRVFKANASSDTAAGSMALWCSSDGMVYVVSPTIRPTEDNTQNLGTSNYRWKQLYAGTTTINTSDERVKQQIATISDDVLDAWSEINFCQFKFNDVVKEKGSKKARYHTGLIAQRIKEKFEAHNIDPFAYGLLCYDEWDATEEEKDDEGNIVVKAQEAGNRYSLRYEECLCVEAAYQRRRADRIEERLKALEEKLK